MARKIPNKKKAPKKDGYGLLRLSFDLLDQLFLLPEGYRTHAIQMNMLYHTLDIIIASPELPEIPEGVVPRPLPEVTLKRTARVDDEDGSAWLQQTLSWGPAPE
jgi:hypothetical protein